MSLATHQDLLAKDIDAACIDLMEAMQGLAQACELLTAGESQGRGARVAIARYGSATNGSMPAAFLGPNGYCPPLNEVALGAFHTIHPHVRSIARPPHGLPVHDPHLIAQIQRAGGSTEDKFAFLEALATLEVGEVRLYFEVSSKDGSPRLDAVRVNQLPLVIDAPLKPGFLAAASGISSIITCLKAAGMGPDATWGDLRTHVFLRPRRRSWPKEIRKGELYRLLATTPWVEAPDEPTAREMVNIAFATAAICGHHIAPSTGQDTLKLERIR